MQETRARVCFAVTEYTPQIYTAMSSTDGIVEADPSASLATFAAWDPLQLDTQLREQAFSAIDASIQAGLAAREPAVVDWCLVAGLQRGHVLPLYHLAHNALRFSNGRVPSVRDVHTGTHVAALLLLRVAQDVVTRTTFLAQPDKGMIYVAFRKMVAHWLLRWRAAVLPSPAAIADTLAAWLQAHGTALPSPVWTTCFEQPLWGCVWAWGTPSPENIASLDVVTELVVKTRADVAATVLAALRAVADWPTFLSMDFTAP